MTLNASSNVTNLDACLPTQIVPTAAASTSRTLSGTWESRSLHALMTTPTWIPESQKPPGLSPVSLVSSYHRALNRTPNEPPTSAPSSRSSSTEPKPGASPKAFLKVPQLQHSPYVWNLESSLPVPSRLRAKSGRRARQASTHWLAITFDAAKCIGARPTSAGLAPAASVSYRAIAAVALVARARQLTPVGRRAHVGLGGREYQPTAHVIRAPQASKKLTEAPDGTQWDAG